MPMNLNRRRLAKEWLIFLVLFLPGALFAVLYSINYGKKQPLWVWTLIPFGPYVIAMLVRSIVWSVRTLKRKPDMASILTKQMDLCITQGQYEQAVLLNNRFLTIIENTYGPDHPGVATSLEIMANLYRKIDWAKASKDLDKRATAIRKKIIGPDHPNAAIRKKALDMDHPDAVTNLENMAQLYRKKGWEKAAEDIDKRVATIRENTYGTGDPDVARQGTKLSNFEKRVLCSDDSCIGVIAPDGRCGVCRKPYKPDVC